MQRLLKSVIQGKGTARPWPDLRRITAEEVKERLNFLEVEAGISKKLIPRSLVRYPQLLGLSLTGLRERLAFLREEIGLDTIMLHRVVCRDPALLKSSVRRTLRPTADFLINEVPSARILPALRSVGIFSRGSCRIEHTSCRACGCR